MKLLVFVLVGLFSSKVIFAQSQPLNITPDFKGVKLGTTFGEVAKRFWGGTADAVLKNNPMIEATKSRIKITPSAFATSNFESTIVGGPARVSFLFERNPNDMANSLLYDIRVDFRKSDVLMVMDGLIEKFGESKKNEDGSPMWIFGEGRYTYTLSSYRYKDETGIYIIDEVIQKRMGPKYDADMADEIKRKKSDL
jgi:hypothetical protein